MKEAGNKNDVVHGKQTKIETRVHQLQKKILLCSFLK